MTRVKGCVTAALISGICVLSSSVIEQGPIPEKEVPVVNTASFSESRRVAVPIEEPKISRAAEENEEHRDTVERDVRVSLGEFRVTAYCACKVCCGKYADSRPVDSDGEPIVYGASGERLIPGISCAAPRDIPFGTELWLDGKKYIVMDRTAKWVEEKLGPTIDIYTGHTKDAHNEAKKLGLTHLEVEEQIHYAQGNNG